ncbi:MAG: BrnT family toxin [Candidatus Methanoperedens sp.]|nr:BrnT family toxin [Candidatus Methanoperedens sp.]MCE8426501.1 BrnT family toxin [Candidatus Methanoperedens sp.]
MKINGLIWYEKIIEKLEQKHNVQQYEVREVFTNNPMFRYVEKGLQPNENVYAGLGQTNGGRYIIIFFIYKTNKHVLIMSARDMTQSERKKYEQK